MPTPYDGKVAVWFVYGGMVGEVTVDDIANTLKAYAPAVSAVFVKVTDGTDWMGKFDSASHPKPDLAINGPNDIKRWVTKLAQNKETAYLSRDLAQIRTNLNIKLDLERAKAQELDLETERRGLFGNQGRIAVGRGGDNQQVSTRIVANYNHMHALTIQYYEVVQVQWDVRDARHVPAEELKALREQVRRLDPGRPVTASFGGHDLDEADLREAMLTIGLDFVSPHRPRDAGSPGQTGQRCW